MRDDAKRVEDILEAILLIEKYSIQDREKFEEKELIQVWIVHHLQIIGESARKISESLKEHHPEIP